MSKDWMIVRRSRTIPGGFRIARHGLTEEQARSGAAAYKRPHQAMSYAELVDRRLVAIGRKGPDSSDGEGRP